MASESASSLAASSLAVSPEDDSVRIGVESANPRAVSLKGASSSPPPATDGCLVRVSSVVNSGLSRLFYKVGVFCGRFPWLTMLLVLGVSGALGEALRNFQTESQPDKLFVPTGTRALADKEDVVQFWGDRVRPFSLVVTGPAVGDNVLTKERLGALFRVLGDVGSAVGKAADGSTYTFAQLCVKVPDFRGPAAAVGVKCLLSSVLEAWAYNETALAADPDVLATLSARLERRRLESLVGGLVFADNKLVSGSAFRVSSLLNSNFTDVDPSNNVKLADAGAEAWETELIRVTVTEPNASWARELEVFPNCITSFVKEVGGSIAGDVGILTASYFLIIIFVLVVVQQKWDRVHSTIALGLGGFVVLGLAIVSAFGLAQRLGYKYGNTHSILPFIVLGVGSDGIFILVNAFRRTDRLAGLPERSGEALAHAGVSLTVSSVTNVAAFYMSSITSIPDLASFAKYACFALAFVYVYLCTFYMAWIVLDERRQGAGRLDLLCCVKDCRSAERRAAAKPAAFVESRISRWMRETYTPFILRTPVRALVLVLAAAACGASIFFTTKLTVEATGSNFLPQGSYVKENVDLQARLFGGGPTDVQVVLKDVSPFASRVALLGLEGRFKCEKCNSSPPYIINDFRYWPRELLDFIGERVASNDTQFDPAELPEDAQLGNKRFPASDALFLKYLDLFLVKGGAIFKPDIVFNAERTAIRRTRIKMQHAPIGAFDAQRVFKEDAGEIVKAVDKMYEITDGLKEQGIEAYPYSFTYTDQWASYKVIKQELVTNLISSLIAVLVVIFLLIGHPAASLIVFGSTLLTVVEILGMNAVMGFSIDTVVTVLVVLSVGLGVDYSAHLVYEFMTLTGTRAERVAATMEDIGVPILQGSGSTLIAVCLQSLSKSYVFVIVFYEFLFAIGFGMLNGLVLVPVVLSLVGPAPYSTAKPPSKKA
jgi:Niemann-Pick C1 protein